MNDSEKIILDISAESKNIYNSQSIERAIKLHRLFAQLIIHIDNEQELLEKICQYTVEEVGYKLAWIGFAKEDKSVVPVASYGFDEEYLKNINISWSDDKFGQGPTGQAIQSGKCIVMHDIQNNKDFLPWKAAAERNGFKSSASIPLKYDNHIYGAINIYSDEIGDFTDEEINILLFAARDLTIGISNIERKNKLEQQSAELFKAKEKAKINENLWLSFTNNSDDNIIITDINHKIVFINRHEFDTNPENILGFSIFSFVDDKFYGLMKETFEIVNKTKQPGSYEIVLNQERFKSNEPIVWFITKVIPKIENEIIAGYILVSSNITERKNIETKLLESEYIWNSLTSNTQNYIQIIDQDCKIQYLNKTFDNSDKIDILGTPIYNYVSEEFHQIIKETIQKVKETCIPHNYETSLDMSAFGIAENTRWYSVNVVPLQNSGVVSSMFLIASDITERKLYERKLQIEKERAEESDRLKTEFINNMSHEIRTPMNGIIGFTDLLNEPDLSTEKRNLYINIIQNSSNHLLKIIDDILEISRLGTKQVKLIEKDICLNNLMLEMFSIFDIKAKENGTPLYYKNGLADIESCMIVDDTKLSKIIGNLLENAIKFTNKGYIEFGYILEKQVVKIYVKDTGIGIKKEKQNIIFDRFSQEENEFSHKSGGLGLGLSIAKENAILLGGDITLESDKGQGSVFYITFPYLPSLKQHVRFCTENHIEKVKPIVLIAEDEEINYIFLQQVLSKSEIDCDIIHAKNGYEAVEMCKTNKQINLVLMDIKMPLINGYDAAKMIKEISPNLPLIAQTAYSTNDDKNRALQSGFDSFLTKPISRKTLVEEVKKYLKLIN